MPLWSRSFVHGLPARHLSSRPRFIASLWPRISFDTATPHSWVNKLQQGIVANCPDVPFTDPTLTTVMPVPDMSPVRQLSEQNLRSPSKDSLPSKSQHVMRTFVLVLSFSWTRWSGVAYVLCVIRHVTLDSISSIPYALSSHFSLSSEIQILHDEACMTLPTITEYRRLLFMPFPCGQLPTPHDKTQRWLSLKKMKQGKRPKASTTHKTNKRSDNGIFFHTWRLICGGILPRLTQLITPPLQFLDPCRNWWEKDPRLQSWPEMCPDVTMVLSTWSSLASATCVVDWRSPEPSCSIFRPCSEVASGFWATTFQLACGHISARHCDSAETSVNTLDFVCGLLAVLYLTLTGSVRFASIKEHPPQPLPLKS